jgi:hypothetical protein
MVTDATAERFVKKGDERRVPYGQLVDTALDALDAVEKAWGRGRSP